jgi:predicted lipoprotein with Yx(FWY)xxD motif
VNRIHPTAVTRRCRRSYGWRLAAITTAGVALLAACGDDDDGTSATSAAGAPATTAPAGTTAAPATAGAPTTAAAPVSTAGAPATAAPATTGATGSSGAPAGAATVATAQTDLGTILVDGNGMTLYAFTPDSDGKPTCSGECAASWPPALVTGKPKYGDLDASVFSLVDNPAGGKQLKAGDWPLYTFAHDSAPGDVNGQGVSGVWFVVAPDGTLIQ